MLAPLYALAAALFLALSTPAAAELNPGHRVDPAIDITVGPDDAPNEMIVYFSPGCPGCIVLQDFLADLHEDAIDEGRLRIVYRLVPQFHHRGTDKALAMERSEWMARWLQCRFDVDGSSAFADSLNLLVSYAMASNRRFEGRNTVWPAIPPGRFASFRSLLRERGVYRSPDQPPCDSERARDVFARNVILLDRTAGENRARVRAPMLIVNGDWYDGALSQGPTRVLAALRFRLFPTGSLQNGQ